MTSVERDVRRVIASFPVQLLELAYHKGHFKFTLQHGERIRKFTAAGSPTNRDVARAMTAHYIKQFIKEVK